MQADSELDLIADLRLDALTFGLDTHTTEAIRCLIDGDQDEALRLMSESHWIAQQQATYILDLQDALANLKALLIAVDEERNRALNIQADTFLELTAVRQDLPSMESWAKRRGYLEAIETLRDLMSERDMDTSILDDLEGKQS